MAKGVLTGKLVGAETIVGKLSRYGDTIRGRLRAEVERSARELVQRAKVEAPKRTGALAGSIGWQATETEKGITAKVGTPIFYGRFQESGWTPNPRRKNAEWVRNPRNERGWKARLGSTGKRKIYAHPYLKPAIASMRGTIRDRLLNAVRGPL